MSRCDDYCCNYGCNQGQHCPVSATPLQTADSAATINTDGCVHAHPAQRQHYNLHRDAQESIVPMSTWEHIRFWTTLFLIGASGLGLTGMGVSLAWQIIKARA